MCAEKQYGWNVTVLLQTLTHSGYDCMHYDLYKKEPDKTPAWMGETHEVPPWSVKLLVTGCYWEARQINSLRRWLPTLQ